MKTTLPPELQANIPKTTWGRVLSSTPVVMTVVATLLAGLASSEMTRAQYDRSLATQQQSKAGDQWSFFQAKRLRSVMQQGTLDALEFSSATAPRQGEALTAAVKALVGNENKDTPTPAVLAALVSGEVPNVEPPKFDPALEAALAAVAAQRPEAEIKPLMSQISEASLAAAVLQAKEVAAHFDETLQPLVRGIDALQRRVTEASRASTGATETTAAAPSGLRQEVVAARVRFTIHRYEAEARVNQTLTNLYELLVRKSNLSADRHYARSQRFFYGMLAAQLSVIMSTFATAVRMRTTLWTLAAVAGLFAVVLAGYVYLLE